MLEQEQSSGDIRRPSADIDQLQFPTLLDVTRAIPGARWQCHENAALNDTILSLCREWGYTNSPIVTSRASPLVSRIRMRDDKTPLVDLDDQEAGVEFIFGNDEEQNKTSLERLRDYIREYGAKSRFGRRRDSVSTLDESVRRSLDVPAGHAQLVNDLPVYELAEELASRHWGYRRGSLAFVLNKFCLYEAHQQQAESESPDHFEYHRDGVLRECGARHVATLELSLESADLEGGRLLFRDFAYESTPTTTSGDDAAAASVKLLDEFSTRALTKLHLFYTDCEHCVEPVTRGYRVSLEYGVVLRETAPSPAKDVAEQQPPVPEDVEEGGGVVASRIIADEFYGLFFNSKMNEAGACLITFFTSVSRTPALMLSHLYPTAAAAAGGAQLDRDVLRGYDRLMYDALEPYFDVAFVPVCLYREAGDGVASSYRCVSLQQQQQQREDDEDVVREEVREANEELTLYVTPTAVHCMDKLGGALIDNSEHVASRFRYATMAMVLRAKQQ